MTGTLPETARTVAAVQAQALEDLLASELPAPGLCVLHADGAVSVQFSGPARLDDLHAWAVRFSVPVGVSEYCDRFAGATFTHMGVRFEPYAALRDSRP